MGTGANGQTAGLMRLLKDAAGNGVLVFTATTGDFVLGAEALEHLLGCTHIQIGTSAPQNSGQRTFTLLQRTSL